MKPRVSPLNLEVQSMTWRLPVEWGDMTRGLIHLHVELADSLKEALDLSTLKYTSFNSEGPRLWCDTLPRYVCLVDLYDPDIGWAKGSAICKKHEQFSFLYGYREALKRTMVCAKPSSWLTSHKAGIWTKVITLAKELDKLHEAV